MPKLPNRISGLCAILLLSITTQTQAQSVSAVESATVAGPQEQAIESSRPTSTPAVLWYRSSEGCPDGARFIEQLGESASLVRLAEAGDRVDFVVNLGLKEEGAQGRLERQTGRGTVAIREVQDASCERVAQVVALNLSLALDPETTHSSPAEVMTAGRGQSGRSSAAEPKLTQPSITGHAPRSPSELAQRPVRWRVGVQGGVLGGVTPNFMGRGTLFIEWTPDLISVLPELSFRLAAVGAWGKFKTEPGGVREAIWAGHFDVCPLALGGARLSARPCLSAELGLLKGSGSISDSTLWGALGAQVRGLWTVAGPWALEAEAGANFPLSRYRFNAGSSLLHRSAVVGISAALGTSFAF